MSTFIKKQYHRLIDNGYIRIEVMAESKGRPLSIPKL